MPFDLVSQTMVNGLRTSLVVLWGKRDLEDVVHVEADESARSDAGARNLDAYLLANFDVFAGGFDNGEWRLLRADARAAAESYSARRRRRPGE